MNIPGIRTHIRSAAVQIAGSPRASNLLRAAKSTIPFLAAGTAGAALYHASPEFKATADNIRAILTSHPRISEMTSSAFFLGLAPDFLTQKYEGKGINIRRLTGMTALGAVNGGILTRGLYTVLNGLFPEQGFWATEQKILVDQLLWCPMFYFWYFSSTNLVEGKTWQPLKEIYAEKVKKSLPLCWAYWGLFGAQLVYNLPNDLRIFAANILSILWFSFMSNVAHRPVKNVTDTVT